jgi:predicted amidophosphoribosyltransferase
MGGRIPEVLEVGCPCCGASLKIDTALNKVIAHRPPSKRPKAPDLERAMTLLQREAERREALFEQSAKDEKIKGQLLERRFDEALKETKGQSLEPPKRDLDLD